MNGLCDFEKRVLEGLNACGVSDECALGAAVSGGADSVSLLYSLSHICRLLGMSLKVITVNHFIRDDEETCGDAAFVVEQCEALHSQGYDVECEVVELARGAVTECARERGGGIEEAARFLRYQAFEKFALRHNLKALCLAHNKNDQLETLLMRFLQGASVEGSQGIQKRRGFYVRPLLEISRSEIEDYLRSQNVSWRTDSTNCDTAYLRNRIRNVLVPVLNKNFGGWQNAVLSGAEKAALDSEIISRAVENAFAGEGPVVPTVPANPTAKNAFLSIPRATFDPLPDGVKIRVLMKMCNQLGEEGRIPYSFLKDVISAFSTANVQQGSNSFIIKQYSSIEISQKKDAVFVKKANKNHTDLVFFDIIEEKGEYEFPFGTLTAGEVLYLNGTATGFKPQFPFIVRNFCIGDAR